MTKEITERKLDFEYRRFQLQREKRAKRLKMDEEDQKEALEGHVLYTQHNLKIMEVINKL